MPNTAYDFLAMIGFCSLGYFIIRILFYFQMPKRNGKDLSDSSACLITLLMIIIGICTWPVTAVWGLLDHFTISKARDVMEQSITKEAHETWSPFSESNKKMREEAQKESYIEGFNDGYEACKEELRIEK